MYERRRLTPAGTLILALVVMLFAIGDVFAFGVPDRRADEIGGTIKAQINGRSFFFPSLKTDISASIQGDLATVTLVQTFANPTSLPLNATYLFPLNKDAAVHFMQMEVGDERVTAVIKKKTEARATYEKAKRAGKAAALLNQHRPNMFTQELANLMPGKPVKIVLKYSMAVPRIDGAYELVVPLVVGPRYTPPKAPIVELVKDAESSAPARSGEWSFSPAPKYPSVSGLNIPDEIAKDRVSIHVSMSAAFPIKKVKSATHALVLSGNDRQKTATLASGRTVDNRDFILRYELSGRTVEAGLLAHKDKRGDFFSLLVEPPKAPMEKDIIPREMVFVLDTSGSMTGQPMEASKTFMRHAINSLRPTDYFRIIRFSSDTGEFSRHPVKASLLNKVAGIKYVNSLRAGGGTLVPAAMERAFGVRQQPDTLRIVTFLSDGYIGNEAQVLRLIGNNVGKARIYAFGVGTSVNRYLLSEMARKGHGFARFIDPSENVNDVAIELANHLDAPLLTDIEVDWGTLNATAVTPRQIPDLFKGDSLRLMAKSSGPLEPGSTHTVILKGTSNGRKAIMPLKLTIPQSEGDQMSALPLLWARTTITDHMRDLTTPSHMRTSGATDKAIEQAVTKLGLEYSLMSQWTSFVAVSEKIVNERPKASVETSVPLNQVKGVSEYAYPKKPAAHPLQKAKLLTQPGYRQTVALNTVAPPQSFGFGGSSTPEPGTIGGMILLFLLMSGLFWRQRRV